MFLSDRDIKYFIENGQLRITPYVPENVQPASIDMTLGNVFKNIRCDAETGDTTDPRFPVQYNETTLMGEGRDGYVLASGDFVLASTIESVELPDNMLGRLEGKSSLGRIGLTAHITAGFFDPGFQGTATLELFNASPRSIVLWPGMKICQMSFASLSSRCLKPYGHKDLGSKYQGQDSEPVGSRMHENF